MTDVKAWTDANNDYLAKALVWLRLRLARQAASRKVPTPQSSRRGFLSRLFGKTQAARVARVTKAELRTAFAAMEEAERQDPSPALVIVGERLGLSRFERQLLLLCAAVELDTGVATLCALAQGDPALHFPTFSLALSLFDEPVWEVLSPERPLRCWRLIEINQPGAQPLTTSAVRIDERILNYLKGLNYLDDRLSTLLVPLGPAVDEVESLPPSQRQAVDTIVDRIQRADGARHQPVVQLLGSDSSSKQLVARHAAASLGLHLYRLPAASLPTGSADLETFSRLWTRDCVLLPVALFLEAPDSGGEDLGGPPQALRHFLLSSNTLVFLDTRDTQSSLERASFTVDINKPAPVEQQAAWQVALGEVAGDSPALLAGQFSLNEDSIRGIASTELKRFGNGHEARPGPVLHERLWAACQGTTRPRFEGLAQRVEPKATWDEIVLPPEDRSLLTRIANQVALRTRVYDEWGFRNRMNRGLGITVLFAGESGTGKTMGAEVLANHLQLDLYRVDLSAVVSKWIGETEKRLRRLFDAAEDGGAILFFDEADALFGKRTEVKESHDRFANIEINYLLQRMETFRGLAILATNMKSALDSAFLRRLRFIVNFPFPTVADRKAIWEKAFPPKVPVNGLDWDRLARFNLTGGSIHNISLNAAFQAAHADSDLTMPLVLDAARTEFRKMNRPINEADFRWQTPKDVTA